MWVFILSIANLSVAKVGRILYNYFINNKEGYIMKYMGSKNRIAKHLIKIMVAEADSKGITNFYDICCGGCNLIDKVPSNFNRYALS